MKQLLAIILLLCLTASLEATERSGRWPSVRKAYLAQHPTCEACGASGLMHVHHVLPVHLYPDRELDLDNLITLCQRCHFELGHLGNYRSFNPHVREDAAQQLARVKPQTPKRWRQRVIQHWYQQAG
jgi:hypothetical protein